MGGIYEADLYDVVTAGTFRGDIEWYRRLARESGGPVLELGAGTGRVTIPIAEDGVSVCALDVDRGMHDRLRHKISDLPAEVRGRVVVREGDMRSFRLDQQFVLVISIRKTSAICWSGTASRRSRSPGVSTAARSRTTPTSSW